MHTMSDSPRTIVLLTPRQAAAAPPAFTRACAERGVTIRHVVEPTGVMVQLSRGADGLIVIDPAGVEHLDELMAAVSEYYPNLDCRTYSRESAGGDGRRSATHEQIASSSVEDEAAAGALATALVTEEELAMLMSPLELDVE